VSGQDARDPQAAGGAETMTKAASSSNLWMTTAGECITLWMYVYTLFLEASSAEREQALAPWMRPSAIHFKPSANTDRWRAPTSPASLMMPKI
jgi:hypothetical protein